MVAALSLAKHGRVAGPVVLAMLLAGCGGTPSPARVGGRAGIVLAPATDAQVPDYAKRPFEPFSRETAIAVAQREWRAFGMLVDDDPPDSHPLPKALRPDQQPGLWQRVGDYWWGGQGFGTPQSGWTSRYNEFGTAYGGLAPAWSAAFISYVMRTAGAGSGFTYSALHADYINAAARGEGVARAEPAATYPPQPGDLICTGRASTRNMRFEDLPAPTFLSHCDIVVTAIPGQLSVIGGNVSGGVTMKHVPTTASGTLAGPGGDAVDSRYPWFVVLRIQYEADARVAER